FVNDLKTLIRSNYTRISYDQFDETNIANYASINNNNGTRSVFCVYSSYEYVYSGTFTWGVMSREHTFCHSWMPSYPSESGDEYSDQHHLFPTQQNNANGVRSNHPLGIVVNAISVFMDGKLGTNAQGQTVYEPRNQQKGDAARALLYMCLRYDGINGQSWTFNWLNNTRLPSLTEAPENLDVLLSWHQQDPPDTWEIGRNNYIYSIQHNKNPFIDHPEYTDYINFNDLSYTGGGTTTFAAEPTNYVTNFAAINPASSSITLTWSDAIGTQLPAGYLLMINNLNNFSTPTDGVVIPDDNNFSDGNGIINVPYLDADTLILNGLNSNTTYYFKIFSYNGNSTERNYKTDGIVPSTSATTIQGTQVNPYEGIFFSEYVEGASFNKALEVFNGNRNGSSIDLNKIRIKLYSNGSSTPNAITNVSLADDGTTSTIPFLSSFVFYHTSFVTPDVNLPNAPASKRKSGINAINFNGDDAIVLEYNVSDTTWVILDVFGVVGNDPGTEWSANGVSTLDNTLRRKTSINFGITNISSSWDEQSLQWTEYANSLPESNLGLHTVDAPLPVELFSFNADLNSNGVNLYWTTATETNNYGFEVERMEKGKGTFQTLNFISGKGNSYSISNYSYFDKVNSGTYVYRLKQIDYNGSISYSHTIEVEVITVNELTLQQNYPNPFNPSTMINFTLPKDEIVSVKIFDVLGREIKNLLNDFKQIGSYSILWNGDNDNNEKMTSGIYFCRISTEGEYKIIKMTLTK
ncbi:MAG: endonuclease, partial [Syntrophothermus sp.]